MDPFDRIIYIIIILASLALFATFYMTEVQSEGFGYNPTFQGWIDMAAGVTVFLWILGFLLLFLNRRMSTSGFA